MPTEALDGNAQVGRRRRRRKYPSLSNGCLYADGKGKQRALVCEESYSGNCEREGMRKSHFCSLQGKVTTRFPKFWVQDALNRGTQGYSLRNTKESRSRSKHVAAYGREPITQMRRCHQSVSFSTSSKSNKFWLSPPARFFRFSFPRTSMTRA